MKTIARMQLEPGMEIAEDIYDYKNNLIVQAGTIVDENCIAKLNRYSVVAVPIKDIIDYATTQAEKVRYSKEYEAFEKEYTVQLVIYKTFLDRLFNQNTFPFDRELLGLYNAVSNCVKDEHTMLDYLYYMLPSDDDLTYAHCFNSALIAGVFGSWLGLSEEDRNTLILCGFYYDVGKFLLPHQLMWKPGKLTELEYTQMKTHTLLGFQILQMSNVSDHVKRATLMHHERLDGTGYPSRLKGGQIDQFARFIAIIDSYEAMTSARSYRKSMHPFQVIENFEKAGPFQYDADALQKILFHIASNQIGLTARLNNGMEGEVIMINQRKLSRPYIKVGEEYYDLTADMSIQIESLI